MFLIWDDDDDDDDDDDGGGGGGDGVGAAGAAGGGGDGDGVIVIMMIKWLVFRGKLKSATKGTVVFFWTYWAFKHHQKMAIGESPL